MMHSKRRAADGKSDGSVTKEKLVEASDLLKQSLITESDFQAIKSKWMQDQMGLNSEV